MLTLLFVANLSLVQLLVAIVICLIVISFIYWAIQRHAPEPIKQWAITIIVLIIVILLIWLLAQIFGGEGAIRLW